MDNEISITRIQKVTVQNAMTGSLWKWASARFAKGSIGDVHVFLKPEFMRANASLYIEETILKSENNIISHIIQ